MEFSVVGMIVGSLFAEYVIQPERMLATKHNEEGGESRLIAGMLHSVVWSVTVLAGGCIPVIGSVEFNATWVTVVVWLAIVVAHHAIDCTMLRRVAMSRLRLPNLESATAQIFAAEEGADEGREVDPVWRGLVMTYGAIGEKMFDASMHVIVPFAGWMVLKWTVGY